MAKHIRQSEAKEHFVYIVQCSDSSLYTGYATDVARRVAEHNGEGKGSGARYTRGRRPVRLVYKETCSSRSAAYTREAAIKKLTPGAKRKLFVE